MRELPALSRHTGSTHEQVRKRFQELDKEILAAVWLDAEELDRRFAEHRSPLVRRCVDDFLAGRRFQDAFDRRGGKGEVCLS